MKFGLFSYYKYTLMKLNVRHKIYFFINFFSETPKRRVRAQTLGGKSRRNGAEVRNWGGGGNYETQIYEMSMAQILNVSHFPIK